MVIACLLLKFIVTYIQKCVMLIVQMMVFFFYFQFLQIGNKCSYLFYSLAAVSSPSSPPSPSDTHPSVLTTKFTPPPFLFGKVDLS